MKVNKSSLSILSIIAVLLLSSCNGGKSKPKKKSSSESTTSGSVDPTSGSTTSGSGSSSGSSSTSPTSTTPVGPEVIGHTDYSECQKAYASGVADNLYNALKDVVKDGSSGKYGDLYNTYKAAYKRDDGYLFDYYSIITNYDIDKDKSSSGHEGGGYNREHSIPKSWWGGTTSEGTQGADPFIVVPSDTYVNGARSNYSFGYVASATKTFSNSKVGSADTSYGYSGTVFEIADNLKGDFARIYFYAIAKYKAYSWNKDKGSSCFSGSENVNFGFTDYAVKLFSKWSNLDPVSEWEVHVNDNVEPIQNNRNPFIDHPEYANLLWGSNSNYTPYNH